MRLVWSAVLVALTVGVAGCGSTASGPRGRYAVDALSKAGRLDAGAYAFVPKRLTDALPTVRYDDGTHRIRASRLAVTGTFTTTTTRTGTVTFRVHDVIAGSTPTSATLTVAMALPPRTDAARFRRSLADLGECLLILNSGRPDAWTLADHFLATVDHNGRIKVRVNGFDITEDATTLTELRKAASQPTVIKTR